MKKLLSLLLAVIMVMSLVACGGKNDTANDGKTNEAPKTETQKDTSTEGKEASGGKVEASTEKTDVPAEYAEELTLVLSVGALDPGDTWNAQREAYQRFVYETLIRVDEVTGEITCSWLRALSGPMRPAPPSMLF